MTTTPDNGFRLLNDTPATLGVTGVLDFETAAPALRAIQFTLATSQVTRLDLAGVSRCDSAGLACVLGGEAPPPLLILDEPTNHLDIESIEAVEAGLRAYDGALLVVSHDEAFLEAVGILRRVELRPTGSQGPESGEA